MTENPGPSTLSFWERWDRFGRCTVDRVGLRRGELVLDACRGTGSSALVAAERVGPEGKVIGIDVDQASVTSAQDQAHERGLQNVEFVVGDIESTGLPSDLFDAIVCVFGIFFLPDMAAGVRELSRLLRPGGRLGLTVWGPNNLEPAATLFWEAVGAERPELVGGVLPWQRITTADALGALLRESGVADAEIVTEMGEFRLHTPEEWWEIVQGTCGRFTLGRLDPRAGKRARTANLAALRARHVDSISLNVIYALSCKPK
jgi:SAM-dependent methyltransferase